MWVILLLKQKDAALAFVPRLVPKEERLDLRNSMFLGSNLLP